MKRLLLPACAAAVLALLALSACMLPPFDVQVSRALAAARKMEHVATIGPVDVWKGLAAGRDVCFLPSRNLGPLNGLLVIADSYGGSLRYVYTDPLDGQARVTMDIRFNADNAGGRFGFAVHMLKDGTADPYLDHFLLVTPGMTHEYTRYELDPAAYGWNSSVSPTWWDLVGTSSEDELVGVSFLPLGDPADSMSFLVLHTLPGQHEEYELQVSAAGESPGPSRQLLGLSAPSAPGFYHHDPGSGRSYYSFYDAGRWLTLAWDSVNAPAQLPIDHRVDRLLSTGDLYCRGGDGIDRVYNPAGNRKYEIAAGSLRLAYETYEGGIATLYYTLVYWEVTAGERDDGRMYIRVYRLPTANLSSLD